MYKFVGAAPFRKDLWRLPHRVSHSQISYESCDLRRVSDLWKRYANSHLLYLATSGSLACGAIATSRICRLPFVQINIKKILSSALKESLFQ
jgi:hypothetical protein